MGSLMVTATQNSFIQKIHSTGKSMSLTCNSVPFYGSESSCDRAVHDGIEIVQLASSDQVHLSRQIWDILVGVVVERHFWSNFTLHVN